MQDLRICIKKAKQELALKIQISPGQKEEMALEIIEMEELEVNLKKYIHQAEEILKQNMKNNK